jgi:hypothetical protein
MEIDEITHILDTAYPLIQKYYGKGKLSTPTIELWKDIYARVSGIEDMEGEHSSSSIAQYDEDENKIFIYYPNVNNEEGVLRALIHEYTHYTQVQDLDSELERNDLFQKYKAIYSYDEDPIEIEAHKNEENWQMFSSK